MDIVRAKKELLTHAERHVEGWSTGCMLLGYILGRGHEYSVLFYMYVIHWVAAIAFHTVMSEFYYRIERLILCLLLCEKIVYLDPDMSFLIHTCLLVQPYPDPRILSIVTVAIIFLLYCGHDDWMNGCIYVGCMSGAILTNRISDKMCMRRSSSMTASFTALFHLLCGLGVYHVASTYTHAVYPHRVPSLMNALVYTKICAHMGRHLMTN